MAFALIKNDANLLMALTNCSKTIKQIINTKQNNAKILRTIIGVCTEIAAISSTL